MIPLKFESSARPRFASYLERSVFNILTRTGASNGTGFFVTRDGYALTCHHVLEDAKKQPIYDDRNRFSIRFLDAEYPAAAEWFPQFSHNPRTLPSSR